MKKVSADEVYRVIQQLSAADRKTVYDLAQYLRDRHDPAANEWRVPDDQMSGEDPIMKEESEQMKDDNFLAWDGESSNRGL